MQNQSATAVSQSLIVGQYRGYPLGNPIHNSGGSSQNRLCPSWVFYHDGVAGMQACSSVNGPLSRSPKLVPWRWNVLNLSQPSAQRPAPLHTLMGFCRRRPFNHGFSAAAARFTCPNGLDSELASNMLIGLACEFSHPREPRDGAECGAQSGGGSCAWNKKGSSPELS
ncbi:hypothetical protein BS50DRAFT_87400 [Corynespora cassiicola Philippines]|uniref:Uncharacterized protein n=1 Tax=Corynespora cassiicola Philippines TaxID=1448308 RepID=A0A2T2NE60_CORCC|nr:hypothetical protein BS50DRAFT_87400 [Corynespora cassiicola Philippines]